MFVSDIIGSIITICIFPGIGYHLLKQGRGKENIENAMHITNYLNRILGFYDILHEGLFLKFGVIILILAVLGLIYGVIEKKINSKVIILLFVGLGYYVVISIVASYVVERYMILVYPIIVCSLYYCADLLTMSRFNKVARTIEIILVMGFLILSVFKTIDASKEDSTSYECYSEYEVICVINTEVSLWNNVVGESSEDIKCFKTATFVHPNSEVINLDSEKYTDKIMVLFESTGDTIDILDKIIKCFGDSIGYREIEENKLYEILF